MVCGRFASVALLRWAAAGERGGSRAKLTGTRLMEVYAVCNTLLCLVAVGLGGAVGASALVLVSFCMSIMYPTIFTAAIVSRQPDITRHDGIVSLCCFGKHVLSGFDLLAN